MVLLPACSQHGLPVAGSRQQSCSARGDTAASIRLPNDGHERDGRGKCAPASVLSSGFSHSKYRPLRLEGCFYPFATCRESEGFTTRRATGVGGRSVFSKEVYSFFFSRDGSLSNTATLCTVFLLLTLGLASICAGSPGPVAVSAPLVCPAGLHPDPLLLLQPLGYDEHLWLPSLSSAHPISTVCTFKCLNARISQVRLSIEHGILC